MTDRRCWPVAWVLVGLFLIDPAILVAQVTVSVHVEVQGEVDASTRRAFRDVVESHFYRFLNEMDHVRTGTRERHPFPDARVEVLAVLLDERGNAVVTVGMKQQCPGDPTDLAVRAFDAAGEAAEEVLLELFVFIGQVRGLCYAEVARHLQTWNPQTDVAAVIREIVRAMRPSLLPQPIEGSQNPFDAFFEGLLRPPPRHPHRPQLPS